MATRQRGTGPDVTEDAAEVARDAGQTAGRVATIVSAIALLFSGFSLYETSLRSAELHLFVPPVIEYAHPSRGPFEVFNVPITIANRGARAATVLSMRMTVNNLKSGETKRFYSAAFGRWREADQGTAPIFSPVAVGGNSSFSRQVLFYTARGEELNRVTDQEGGRYRLDIVAETTASQPFGWLTGAPSDRPGTAEVTVTFEMDSLDYRAFQNGGTLPMYQESGAAK